MAKKHETLKTAIYIYVHVCVYICVCIGKKRKEKKNPFVVFVKSLQRLILSLVETISESFLTKLFTGQEKYLCCCICARKNSEVSCF